MKTGKGSITILLADDDAEDRMMAKEALEESKLANQLFTVVDGEDLLDFLFHRTPYEDTAKYPRSDLILLDLNMPKMDGRAALREIKAHPELRRIPVVVLTTSTAEEDILRAYDLGANSFIIKPVSYSGLVDIMQTLGKYWLEIVALPPEGEGR